MKELVGLVGLVIQIESSIKKITAITLSDIFLTFKDIFLTFATRLRNT